jgi:hypothetical protein
VQRRRIRTRDRFEARGNYVRVWGKVCMGIAQGSKVMIKLKVTQWDDSAWKKRDKVYIALR